MLAMRIVRKEMNRPIVDKIQNMLRKLVCTDRAGLRTGSAGQLFGSLRRHLHDREYGASKLTFPEVNCPKILGTRPEGYSSAPYRFEGVPNYLPAWAPTCLGSALCTYTTVG